MGWVRAAAGGQVWGGVGGAKGPAGWGRALGAQLPCSWWGPRRDGARHRAETRGGWAQVPGGSRMGGSPGKGESPAASAALGASASLFLGINIYRSICCLPYTLGCLPPGKNRAGTPAPPLPLPTRAEDRGGQVRPAAYGSAGGSLVWCGLAASPAVRWDGVNRGPIAAL